MIIIKMNVQNNGIIITRPRTGNDDPSKHNVGNSSYRKHMAVRSKDGK